MKILLIAALAASGGLALADQSSFVQAYDAGKFDEAAKQVDGLDTSHAGVARRLGVMYYNGKGVDGDQAKGRTLLEQAMMAGDATAAVNLAKIYFKVEKNSPKAAWCLIVAEGLKDASVKDDVAKLRGYLGDDYLKGVASYIAQLRDLLASEQTALKNKTAESERERTSLTKQITSCQDEAKKKDEAFAREREEMKSSKANITKRLCVAENTVAADKKEIDELRRKVAVASSDRASCDRVFEELKLSRRQLSSRDVEVEKLKKKQSDMESEAKRVGEELEKFRIMASNSCQKVEDLRNELTGTRQTLETLNENYTEKKSDYCKLVDRYNSLALVAIRMSKKYTRQPLVIMGMGYDGSEVYLNDDQSDIDDIGSAKTFCFSRGMKTFLSAPCNYLRVGKFFYGIYRKTRSKPEQGTILVGTVIVSPLVLVFETLPVACDLGDGLGDMLTGGLYGNWLYSGDIKPDWYRRNDEHFPWLD